MCEKGQYLAKNANFGTLSGVNSPCGSHHVGWIISNFYVRTTLSYKIIINHDYVIKLCWAELIVGHSGMGQLLSAEIPVKLSLTENYHFMPRQCFGILCHILDYRKKNKEILSKNFLENYPNEIMCEFLTYIWKDSIWTQKFVNIFTFLFVPPSTSIFLVISNQLWSAFMLIMNTIMLSCWQAGLFSIFYVGDAQLWCNSDDWLSGLS